MRTKQLFLALALPTMFAACSNEEFVNDNATPVKGDLVELGEDFALVGQGIGDTSTRGLWEQNLNDNKLYWSWLPEISSGGNEEVGESPNAVKVNADKIGLCWTGELADGTGSIGSKVFTNYEFLHSGWLAKGQAAANFDVCYGTLKNGRLYKDVHVKKAGDDATEKDLKDAISNTEVEIGGKYVKLDANTGVFKTENKAIFGGSYIVYYPYNGDFSDVASLPATSPAIYENVKVNDLAAKHVAKNTFLVGYAKDLVGGNQASDFSLNPLSAIVSLQLRQADGTKSKRINKVALWSEDGFVTSVSLDAAKVKSSGAKGGETLYVGEEKASATIVAGLESPTSLNIGTTSNTAYTKIYLPILPTTLSGLKVVVYAEDGTIAVKELSGEYKFEAGAGKSVKVDLKVNEFKSNVRIAVDAVTLKSAAGVAGSQSEPATVTVIGDITLKENVEVKEYVTVEGGKIIVPEDKILSVSEHGIVKSTVDVKGLSCCGVNIKEPGQLWVLGGTVAGRVNLLTGEKEENNDGGKLLFLTGKVAASAEIVADARTYIKFWEGPVEVFGTLTLEKCVKTDVETDAVVAVKGGKINNSGIFEVLGDFSMLDAAGTTVAAAGKNFKNNGQFIDNVGAKVGGATQYMEFGENGEYICKVDGENRMNEAYENKTAASAIEIIGVDTYTFAKIRQHNGKDVDIVISDKLPTNSTVFDPGKAITIGKLTVKQGLTIFPTEEVKSANGSHVGWATITVNNDIVVDAGGVILLNEDVRSMKAKNLTVKKGGYARFENRNSSQDKTLAVSGTIDVKQEGTFEINSKANGKNIALVTCTKLIEGGTFIGKPEVVAE